MPLRTRASKSLVRVLTTVALAAVVTASAASGASAAGQTRFASPIGGANAPCTQQLLPCDLVTAVGQAVNGDTVVLAADSGTYAMGATNVLSTANIDIHGDFTSPTAPEIDSSAANALTMVGATSTLEYVTIVNKGNPVAQGTGLAFAGKSVDRVVSVGTGIAAGACYVRSGIVRDSVCVATATNGMAVRLDASGSTTVKLRNVTAYDVNTSVNGAISVHDGLKTTATTLTALLDNVIAHDPPNGATQQPDIVADTIGSTVSSVKVTVSHSNFAKVAAATGTIIDTTTDANNQDATTKPPVFLNPTAATANNRPAFDFEEDQTSPTIDSGAVSTAVPPDDGTLDPIGNARQIPAGSPDIGAYEYGGVVLPPPPPTTTTTTTPTTTTTVPTTTTTPPPTASRFAAPGGSPANAPCLVQSSPCDVATAVGSAVSGDAVVLAAGRYDLGAAGITDPLGKDIDIHGDFGSAAPPELDSSAANILLVLGVNSTVEHLTLVSTAAANAQGTGLAFAGKSADGLIVRGTGVSGGACFVRSGILRDSLCVATSHANGIAVRLDASGTTQTLKLRNVTAYNMLSSTNGAIFVHDQQTVSGATLTAKLDNVIAHNPPTTGANPTTPPDVVADTLLSGAPSGAAVNVTLSHSNFGGVAAGLGSTISVSDPTNQPSRSFAPHFVNPTASPVGSVPPFDFEEASDSKTIDAGLASGTTDDGVADPIGNARVLNGVPDIGAFEYDPATPGGKGGGTLPPPPPPTTTTTTTPPPTTTTTTTTPHTTTTTTTTTTTPPPTTTTTTTVPTTTTPPPTTSTTPPPTNPGPAPDTTPPALSSVTLRPGKFAVTTTRSQNPRISYGALLSYKLSEAAHVTGTLVYSRPGRKVGSACKPQTKRNKKKRACTMKPVTLSSTLSLTGLAGTNALSFSGKVNGKALKVGTYQLKLVAKDAAGNSSQTTTIAFKIVAG